MKQKMDKLKLKLKSNNKLIIFLVVLTFIGIISGTIFSLIISANDKKIVSEYLADFLSAVQNNDINQFGAFINAILDNFSIPELSSFSPFANLSTFINPNSLS